MQGFRSKLAGALLCLSMGLAHAQVAKPFDPTVKVGGNTLVLNGSGTRHKAIFSVYDLGLYLPKKSPDPLQVLDMPGPKRVSFVARRDIPGDQFGLAMIAGMRQNLTKEQLSEVTGSMTEVIALFSSQGTLRQGQAFHLDYVPGQGARFFVDGVDKGVNVAKPQFMRALLSIWLGERPIEPLLKDDLLGVARTAPSVQ